MFCCLWKIGFLLGDWTLNCWDVAAGWLVLQESGAVMKTIEGGEVDFFEPKFCAAATEELFFAMQNHLLI